MSGFDTLTGFVKNQVKGTKFDIFSKPINNDKKTITNRLVDRLKDSGFKDIDKYMYPIDMGSDSDTGNNFMVFYVNEVTLTNPTQTLKRIDTKSLITDVGSTSNMEEAERKTRQVSAARNFNNTEQVEISSNPTARIRSGTSQITKAIVLYLPDNLQTAISHGWTGQATRQAQIAKMLGDTVMSAMSLDLDGAKKNLPTLKNEGIEIFKERMFGDQYKALRDSSNRSLRNPAIQFLYQQPGPREFSYTFKFAPRSIEELVSVYNIIRTFKYHSLPDFTHDKSYSDTTNTTGMTGIGFPGEFNVEFYSGPFENQWMYKTLAMGLNNMTVNFTGTDSRVSFLKEIGDTGNPPQMITLNLSFTELEIQRKSLAVKGY